MSSGILFPEIQFSSWRNDELSDPDGTRHLVSGHFAYTKLVGTGCDNALVFPGLVLDAGENEPFAESDVVVLNISVPNFGELNASGLSAVYNMKLWVPSGSVLDAPGSNLEFQTSPTWTPNLVFPSGGGQQFLRELPSQFNIQRIDGAAELTSFNNDHVSEWVYMKMFLDSDFSLGAFGACGSGTLRVRLTFDFY